jgi:hypothetical protein
VPDSPVARPLAKGETDEDQFSGTSHIFPGQGAALTSSTAAI